MPSGHWDVLPAAGRAGTAARANSPLECRGPARALPGFPSASCAFPPGGKEGKSWSRARGPQGEGWDVGMGREPGAIAMAPSLIQRPDIPGCFRDIPGQLASRLAGLFRDAWKGEERPVPRGRCSRGLEHPSLWRRRQLAGSMETRQQLPGAVGNRERGFGMPGKPSPANRDPLAPSQRLPRSQARLSQGSRGSSEDLLARWGCIQRHSRGARPRTGLGASCAPCLPWGWGWRWGLGLHPEFHRQLPSIRLGMKEEGRGGNRSWNRECPPDWVNP